MNAATEAPKKSQVDAYIRKTARWQAELDKLRAIIVGCKLSEDLKWGKPCYTLEGRNVVLMIGFKDYCALLFPNGALLKDGQGLLVRPSENTQAARQVRFTDAQQVDAQKAALKALVLQAIEVEKAGLKVPLKTIAEFAVPQELQQRLDGSAALKKAFQQLTPGRQRAYLLHVASAKQAATRAARVDKCIPRILAGKGLDD